MMEELLIWVDENDRSIGYGEKMDTHVTGQLHRAFSLFILDYKHQKMLIHKRAIGKYHSGGLWTNACCSHPRKGEKLRQAVIRRAKDELGIELESYSFNNRLLELGAFQYYQQYDNCAEHEIDHVFLLLVDDVLPLQINKKEISEFMWIEIPDLLDWLKNNKNDFTSWFAHSFKIVQEYMSKCMSVYF